MQPFTLVVPKELVPVGSRPAIHWVIEEAATAGIREVGIVVGPGKELIRSYIDRACADGLLPALEVAYLEQPEPRGLGDAMLRCRSFIGDDSFALLLPDNLPLAPSYRLGTLIDLHQERDRDVLGVLELGAESSGRYMRSGLFEGEEVDPGVFAIARILDKERSPLVIRPQETVRRTCGRSVWRPEILDLLAELQGRTTGELDEVQAAQIIAREEGLLGLVLDPPLFDVGHPEGLAAANAHYLAGLPGEA